MGQWLAKEKKVRKKKALSPHFEELVEQRYALVVALYRIKQNVDLQIAEEIKNGRNPKEIRKEIIHFADPTFIETHFEPLIPIPKYIELATLEGHTYHVVCLTLYGNKLFSGSFDKTIRVWNADTHEHLATLEGHTDAVRCLTLYGDKLFSGSRDGAIRVWNVKEED